MSGVKDEVIAREEGDSSSLTIGIKGTDGEVVFFKVKRETKVTFSTKSSNI